MGWLWASSSDRKNSLPSQTSNFTPDRDPSEQTPPAKSPSPSKPLTRDELADAEFQALLKELAEPSPPSSTQSHSSPSTTSSPSTSQPSPPTGPPNSESIYPSTLSCRSLFDASYHCQLLGGQFLNVYRYGTLRDCSDLWRSFWFCMRTNRGFMSDQEREERVRGYYRGREERLRRGPCSEDVWEARSEAEILGEVGEGGGGGDGADGERRWRVEFGGLAEWEARRAREGRGE